MARLEFKDLSPENSLFKHTFSLEKAQADHQAKTPDNDSKKISDSIRDTASRNYHHTFDFELKQKEVKLELEEPTSQMD